MKKEIIISGPIEELILCEFYLVLMGYDNNEEEEWNNACFEYKYDLTHIYATKYGVIEYHNHTGSSFKYSTHQFLSQFV